MWAWGRSWHLLATGDYFSRFRSFEELTRDGRPPLPPVAEASRLVSDSLDASDVLGDSPYVLEVTSPGVDRPLTQPRHWRRARGRLVTCSLRDGTSVVGRVLESHDTAVTLATENGTVEVPLADIAKGQIEVEFRRVDEKGD